MFNIMKEYKIYALFFLIFFLINNQISLILTSDDGKYLNQVNEQGIIGFVLNKSLNWTPRFYSFFYQAIMYKSLLLWKIINSIVMTLSLILIEKIITLNNRVNKDNIKFIRIFIISSIFIVYPYVITNAVLWYTGSFFYLWPFLFFLISILLPIYVLYNKEINNKYFKILIIISTLLCSYTEQYVLVLVFFTLIVNIYAYIQFKKIDKLLLIQLLIACINLTIFMFLQLRTERQNIELFWFPNFDMLSITEKIYNGISFVNGHYINQSNIIFLLLSFFVFFIYFIEYRKKNNSIIADIVFFSPLIYITIRLIPFDNITTNFWIIREDHITHLLPKTNNAYNIQDILNTYVYNTLIAAPNHMVTNKNLFIPSFLSFSIIILLGLSIFILISNIRDKILYTCLYGAAIVSGYIISFSPTIFASGSRIFFLGNMLIIILVGKLYFNILENHIEKYKKIIIVFSLFLILNTILVFFQYYFQYTGWILWL